MAFVKKEDVVKHISGGKDYAKTAELLEYANVQMVYNWPKKIGITLLKAIVQRMRIARIPVPADWIAPKKTAKGK